MTITFTPHTKVEFPGEVFHFTALLAPSYMILICPKGEGSKFVREDEFLEQLRAGAARIVRGA